MQKRTLAKRNTSVITQSQALYLLKTIWKDAPEAEVIKAAILCRQYNLNPLMRQVYLVQFGKEWVTILGIKATRQIAQQALIKRGIRYSYQDGPRVMSEREQVKIRGKVEPEKIWAVTIIQDSFGNTFPGYGWWPANKQPYGSDKGNDAFNMAFIRSERNALDKLAPGELPDVDTGDESYVVGDFKAALNEGKQQIIADADQDIRELWGEPTQTTTSTPEDAQNSGIEGIPPASNIDPLWLGQTLGIIKWREETAKSWIRANLKVEVSPEEEILVLCNRLSTNQLQVFTKKLADLREAAGQAPY